MWSGSRSIAEVPKAARKVEARRKARGFCVVRCPSALAPPQIHQWPPARASRACAKSANPSSRRRTFAPRRSKATCKNGALCCKDRRTRRTKAACTKAKCASPTTTHSSRHPSSCSHQTAASRPTAASASPFPTSIPSRGCLRGRSRPSSMACSPSCSRRRRRRARSRRP